MSTAAPALTAFNSGELSPLLDARIDFSKYGNGCKTLDNMIPTVQGPAVKRPGTKFVATVKTQANQTWLSTFEYNVSNAYVLEFGDRYIRFYTQHGQLISGTPVEVVTPYLQADLFNSDGTCRLRMAQSGDFLYITHPSYEPRILQRTTATSFTLTTFRPEGGPFEDLNTTATTVYASAETGSGITLTASAATFEASHVGALFLLEAKNTNSIAAWEAGVAIALGNRRRVSSRVYEALNAATTGTATPVHTEGARYDGNTGVQWQFRDPGYGWVRITAFASSTSVTADVLSRLPSDTVGVANATTRWALGAWNAVDGWPSDVAFFRERLVMARRQQIWMSTAGGFDDFSARDPSGSVTTDMAVSLTLSSGKINDIQWLLPDRSLLAGTAGGEFSIGELQNGNPIGPGNVRSALQSQFGSRAIVPVQAGAAVLFVQRAGRKVREIAYDSVASDGSYQSNDRTALAEHITKSGVVDIDYAQEPYSIAWCTRTDGKLVGFTWNSEQNVWGWHGHTVGGASVVVESVAAIPSPDGSRNELWLIVKRTINGATTRYVEYMEAAWDDSQAQSAAFYVDSGLSYNGAATTAISGLSHLEGQTVSVLADGAPHPQRTVTAGAITLQRAASVVHVGLPYAAKMQTMRIEAGAQNGTAQGKTKRLSKVTFRFHKTASGQFGPSFSNLDEFTFRTASDPMDAPVPLFSGDKTQSWPGGYDSDGYVCFYDDLPLPVTLEGVFPILATQDAR